MFQQTRTLDRPTTTDHPAQRMPRSTFQAACAVAIMLLLPAVTHAAAVDVVADFHCPNDGTADAAPAINRAIKAAEGRPVVIPAGLYLLEGSIVPIAHTTLEISPEAELRRGWNGGNGGKSGAMINPVMRGKSRTIDGPTDVVIRGGRWTNPGNQFTGRVVCVYGKRWLLDGLKVESWGTGDAGSICISVIGEDIEGKNIHAVGSGKIVGQAGVRVLSGRRIRFSDCYMEAGDDTFCAFPVELKKSFSAGIDLSDVVFERCKGISFAARFLACGLTVNPSLGHSVTEPDQLNAVKVSQIRFVDCEGESRRPGSFAPAFFVILANPSTDAAVREIEFIRCTGKSPDAARDTVRIASPNGARIGSVVLRDCRTSGGKQAALVAQDAREISFLGHTYNNKPFAFP